MLCWLYLLGYKIEAVDQMLHKLFSSPFSRSNCNNFTRGLQINLAHSHKDYKSYTYKMGTFINPAGYPDTWNLKESGYRQIKHKIKSSLLPPPLLRTPVLYSDPCGHEPQL